MAFQTPLKIVEVLEAIRRREYFLPMIQREFVWDTDQIERLFDSLMREYPIGSFLFWQVESETTPSFKFYEFIRDFHERDALHNPIANVPEGQRVTVILDGQQRLSALNIGLQGSHAKKIPRLRRANPEAYPKKHLYLDLLNVNLQASVEELAYTFRFLEDRVARDETATGAHLWFRVGDILGMPTNRHLREYTQGLGLGEPQIWSCLDVLDRLQAVVHRDQSINHYLEKSQDIDKVLNIFIRVNEGGTPLSYSDLLLSVATAQWVDRDARQEIHSLVDSMNRTGHGFAFSKDRVLKAALVLGEFPDIKFKAVNFNRPNMIQIEQKWDEIKGGLEIAVRLLADFGYSSETLSSENVLIPIAYYAKRRTLRTNYLNSSRFTDDRARIRSFATRSLLKGGIWTGAVDPILTKTRDLITDLGSERFPLQEIEAELARQRKSLTFADDELEALLDISYANRRKSFMVLSLLYSTIDVRREFHVDHVFPRSRFTKRQLVASGVAEALAEEYISRVNQLPNLQLLEGPYNQDKSDVLPHEWLARQYPDQAARNHYQEIHDLQDLPEDLVAFLNFFEQRKKRMEEKLRRALT